ncbi:MAG TPA: cyclic nucleotide-binding domain-containing protein [Humisphaera sp.]|jgi:CRP-like cAMP-binding protein|nr:cyclic nucleotide-binding domain-containing protein [Humisphaera sp.]
MGNDVLAAIPIFAKLSDDERAALAALLKEREFPAHQPVFWLGERGDDFYVVERGKVTVSAPDEAGKEIVLATLGPGHFFGEISLLDGGPRTATVRALNNVTLLALQRADFLKFLAANPGAAIHMLTILGQRQRDTLEKMRGIRNANEAIAESRTRWERTAERIANMTATQWFLLLNILFSGGWVFINMVSKRWFHKDPFDEAPFGLLGFIITVEALFISLFVLISQSQQGTRDRIRADLDYQVNLKAHQEVMQLHQKVDRLQGALATVAARVPGGAGEINDGTTK